MNLDETFLPIDASAPDSAPDTIRLGDFQQRSYVAGPGCRAVLWVTGCLRRCPGCIKPQFLSFEVGELVSVENLARRILAIPGLDGVTYSGGEPFEQALPLAKLSRRLKQAGLSVASYSGYRREALQADRPRFGPLLDQLDLLIDGEYLEDAGGPWLWRGSGNQRLHVLSETTATQTIKDQSVQEIQIAVEDGRIRITGFPDQATEKALLESLQEKGFVMDADHRILSPEEFS